MTKPDRKKPGPKPKVQPMSVQLAESAEVYAEAIVAPVEPVEAAPVAPVASSFPLIDGVEPKWAASVAVGSRHVQFVAKDDVKHADLIGMLSAGTVTILGQTPTLIASRTITPPKLHPVRVTFTVRENINA